MKERRIIMPSTRCLFSVIWLIALLHLPSAFAMQRDRFPKPSDYAVRMPGYDARFSYHEVPAAKGVCPLALHDFKRIKDWQRPPDQTDEPKAIQFKFRREGDAIEVDLSLIFGPIEKFRTLPRKGLPAESIGSYSLRLGESASLQELARFGVEPFEIKVVSAHSRAIDPSRVVNWTKSVEVVRVDKARDHYLIAFKNTSSKNIIGMRVYFPTGEAPYGGFLPSHSKPLMAPGEVYELEFYEPGHKNKQGKREPVRFTVAGVVFDDFTYEGEKENAFQIAARIRGEEIQWHRIISMLKEAVAAYGQNKQRALDKLKKDAAALGTEPENSMIADLIKRFSPLTEKELSRLIYHLKDQLNGEKCALLRRIEYGESLERTNGGFLESPTKDGGRENWLTAQRNGYEKVLRELLSFGLLR